MAALTITEARLPADLPEIQALVTDFLGYVRVLYADEVWLVERYYAPEAMDRLLAELPILHAPPRGVILVAWLQGETRPVGCIMGLPLTDTIAEMKRLYVRDEARGRGAGRQLCTALMDWARRRHYQRMRLETGHRQTDAIAAYGALGFRIIPPYQPYDDAMAERMVPMEIDLE